MHFALPNFIFQEGTLMINDRYKTVDDMVNDTESRLRFSNVNVYEHIVYTNLLAFKTILMSETNIPSKHDLNIINEIMKDNDIKSTMLPTRWKDVTKDILWFYKNRKDL